MSFWELVVIFIVALIVLGPKQLPRIAYYIGVALQRIKRYLADLRQTVNDEVMVDDLKRSIEKTKSMAKEEQEKNFTQDNSSSDAGKKSE